MVKKQEDDIPTKFWNEWLDGEEEKRIELLKKTFLVRKLSESLKLKLKNSKTKKRIIDELAARTVNDFLCDFEQVLLSRISSQSLK
ncbi:MAG: hypothetical protein KJ583_06760 [Nanoarchaeota archaeon]|nr:hypothetical protein [Nanoarchaeota archaeon]MBU1270085.1 hypothetical protein [Nanoarchaeota archaeon]MBU1604986.1 hypothetical protein [Nanoarchaeota archaeon]MBU2443421.1 hypothetical protein [Nanoarchaeota archaeon]